MAGTYQVAAVALLATLLSGTALAQARDPVPPSTAEDTAPSKRNTPTDTPTDSNVADRSTAPSPSAAQSAPLSESKMDQFVNAFVAVQSIHQSAATDLNAANDSEEIEAVKQKAEDDMVAAVERSGLAVAEFNDIVQTMQVDENVRSQIAAKVQARMGKPTE